MDVSLLLEIPADAGSLKTLWERVFNPEMLDRFREQYHRDPHSREELVSFYRESRSPLQQGAMPA